MFLRPIFRLIPLVFGALALTAGEDAWPVIGRIAPRHARDIPGSLISVGAETMGRDFTVYKHWREFLGPLGAKGARLQSGWAKTEQEPGVYDWAWLDEIVPDMVDQGVKPWMCLCYGNSIYEGGGRRDSGSPLPTGEALKAWDAFVAAIVDRYGAHIDEWEIWNEPMHKKIKEEPYATFVVRTATIIRRLQPTAKIDIISCAGIDKQAFSVLDHLKQAKALDLVSAITYHPYRPNPDTAWGELQGFRKRLATYREPPIALFQGENGCPSQKGSKGALSGGNWTETSQAKWALRRLLDDVSHGIRTSYFSIADMHYRQDDTDPDSPLLMNTKGLLATNPDKTVKGPKQSYRAVQYLTAIFDSTMRIETSAVLKAPGDLQRRAWTHEPTDTPVAAFWNGKRPPTNGVDTVPVTVTVPAIGDPAYVDLLTGRVRAIPPEAVTAVDGGLEITGVPVGDWPVLVAGKAALVSLVEE